MFRSCRMMAALAVALLAIALAAGSAEARPGHSPQAGGGKPRPCPPRPCWTGTRRGRHRARRHAPEVPARERPLHGLCAGLRVRRCREHRRPLRAVPRVREPGVASRRLHPGGSRGGGIHRPRLLLPATGCDAADDLYGVPGRPPERGSGGRRGDRAGGSQRHHRRTYGRWTRRRDLDALRGRSDHARRVGLRTAAIPPVATDAVARVHAAAHAAVAVAVPCRAPAESHEPSLHP